jgi:hypothetical protein
MWRRFGEYFGRRGAGKQVSESEVFAAVEQKLRNEVRIPKNRWHRHTDFTYLKSLVADAVNRATYAAGSAEPLRAAEAWLEALVLQAPGAALAQVQMDKHKHSYHNREARVMELIDFNDAYVQAVLTLPASHLHGFNDDLKRLIDWFCKRMGAWTFSTEQFEAITHGLSREIAVYNAVHAAGFEVHMTNRAEDAFGIDMHIIDRATGKRVNIDTKTSSAFHYRLIELLREGRLSDADIDLAERRGYTAVMNGHGTEKVRVILWRIDHGTLGDIIDFAFERTDALIEELGQIMREYGEGGE